MIHSILSIRFSKILLLVAAMTFSGTGIASAQTATLDNGKDEPVEIEADNGIEWVQKPNETSGYYKAIGNARAKQGAMNIRADELVANYNESAEGGQEMHRIDAEGNVIVNQNQTNAYGDRGAYHTDRQVAILVGDNLKLKDPKAVITAEDSLEFWNLRNIAVARGNAVLKTEDKVMRSGVMTAFIQKNKTTGENEVQRVDATSGVHISTPTEIITGKEGVYDLPREIATLCGDVKITRGKSQMNGDCAEVNMKTGHSRLLGGGGRVQGLISPPAN